MKQQTIMLVAGARPNFMKVAPLFHALSARKESARNAGIDPRVSIVHMGRHCDPNLSDIFSRKPGMPAADRHLDVGSGSHAEQTAKIMVAFEKEGRPCRRADRGRPAGVPLALIEPGYRRRYGKCA